jgi:hypothetical protein
MADYGAGQKAEDTSLGYHLRGYAAANPAFSQMAR